MNYHYDPIAERANAWEAMSEKMERERAEKSARPFRFEDLNGKPEPEKWGPVYPKTASASVEKWRAIARGRELTPDETRAYGAAVGEWIRALNRPAGHKPLSLKYVMPDFAAQARARVNAAAARDRREWAAGKLKDSQGRTIREAYAQAMADKRARERFLADVDAFNAAQPCEAA